MIYDLSAPRPDGTQPKQVVLYGETYGPSVQELAYGITALDFKAFDLVIDGRFLNYDEFSSICQKYDVPTAPLVYRGPYSLEKIREISSGKTLINDAGHIREGVVVKPTTEMTDPRVGRMIFKYISDDYLLAKEPDSKNRVLITEKSDD